MRRIFKYVFALAVCLTMGSSMPMHADACHPSHGYSSYRTSYPVSTVTYQTQMSTGSYTPAARNISAFDSDFGQGAKLSTYFRSTTADELLSDYSAGAPGRGNSRRSNWGDPDDSDLPTGVVQDTPVGSPLVLLVMAVLYIACRVLMRRGVIRLHRSAQTAAAE